MKKISLISCVCFFMISILVKAQHDAGRNAVRFLAKGEFDMTLEALDIQTKNRR